jgi:hypothetical protein
LQLQISGVAYTAIYLSSGTFYERRLPVTDIIANTENTAQRLNNKAARENVKACLEHYQPRSKPRLSNEILEAVSTLRNDESVIILPRQGKINSGDGPY